MIERSVIWKAIRQEPVFIFLPKTLHLGFKGDVFDQSLFEDAARWMLKLYALVLSRWPVDFQDR